MKKGANDKWKTHELAPLDFRDGIESSLSESFP